MTHPYREELAGRLPGDLSERLEAIASALPNSGLWDQSVATLREAAAALRQSPSVEEVANRVEAEVRRRIAIYGDQPNGDVYRGAMHEAFLLFRDELGKTARLCEGRDG